MFLFHVASMYSRESISLEGLRGSSQTPIWYHAHKQPRGNYTFQYINHAVEYGKMICPHKRSYICPRGEEPAKSVGYHGFDIWMIDTEGISFQFDPENILMGGPLPAPHESSLSKCWDNNCDHEKITWMRWFTEQDIAPERLELLDFYKLQALVAHEKPVEICEYRDLMLPLPKWEEVCITV